MQKSMQGIFIIILIIGALSFFFYGENKAGGIQKSAEFSYDKKGPEKVPLIVILTFDYEDLIPGPGTERLPAIFDLLEKHNATATFFVLGATAARSNESISQIRERGYSLGLHTYYHNFPIFKEGDAKIIGIKYNNTPEKVWSSSFKTTEAFYHDILATQRAISSTTNSTPNIFRCPSLVISWTKDERYFDTLKKANITLDSSVEQDWNNPRPYYIEKGVVEVPVVASEKGIDNPQWAYGTAEKCVEGNVPLSMYFHPQEMTETRIENIENYLTNLERKYSVKYIKVEEVQAYYTS